MREAIRDAAEQEACDRHRAPIAAKCGARVVPGAGKAGLKEVRATARVLFVEFPDLATAQACHDGPARRAACQHAPRASHRELLVFEGDPS